MALLKSGCPRTVSVALCSNIIGELCAPKHSSAMACACSVGSISLFWDDLPQPLYLLNSAIKYLFPGINHRGLFRV